MTSTNVDNRSLGTKLLSEVLTQLDPGCLNSDEGWYVHFKSMASQLIPVPATHTSVHYIIEFYCDRLKDKAVLIPHVLIGIHTLVSPLLLILIYQYKSTCI